MLSLFDDNQESFWKTTSKKRINHIKQFATSLLDQRDAHIIQDMKTNTLT